MPAFENLFSSSTLGPNAAALFNRRDLLRVGSLSIAASLVPGLPRRANAETVAGPLAFSETAGHAPAGKAKSVIFLWMAGGVTHIDSFDPKPEAPEEIRGTLTAIDTCLPGVHFCETLPNLARIADRLAVVRSYSHDSNDHLLSQVYTLSGRKVTPAQLFTEPNIGSIISYLYGPRHGLPGYIAVPGITRPGPPPHNLFVGGWLGNQYAPFCVGGQPEQPDFTVGEKLDNPPAEADEDLNPRELTFPAELTVGRINRRAGLRKSLDHAAYNLEAARKRGLTLSDSARKHPSPLTEGLTPFPSSRGLFTEQALAAALDGQYDSALNLLTSPSVRGAFDLSNEPPALRDAYGRTKIGGRCLLARKLVEAGARFVMVDYGYDPDYGNVWDIHNAPSQNFPHVSKMCQRGYSVAGIDRAFAALITDLETRGLLESTLVVFLTEFGRTPNINSNGGRDHWGAAGSLFFTGAGTKVGQVVGATDKHAAYPTTRPYGPADIAATIYHTLGVNPDTRLPDRQNRPVPVLDHGVPIAEVV